MSEVQTIWWPPGTDDLLDNGELAVLKVEHDEPDEIALHTFVNNEGSKSSYYFSREQAIALIHELSIAVQLR